MGWEEVGWKRVWVLVYVRMCGKGVSGGEGRGQAVGERGCVVIGR